MNIESYIKAINEQDLLESKASILKSFKPLLSLTWKKAMSKMKQSFVHLTRQMKENGKEKEVLQILNKYLNTNYKSLDDIQKQSIKEGKISSGLGNWWGEAKSNFYGAVSFYPLLTAFIELDKLVKGSGDANAKYVLSYALLWAFIVSGKIVFNKGIKKKDNSKDIDSVGKAYMEMS